MHPNSPVSKPLKDLAPLRLPSFFQAHLDPGFRDFARVRRIAWFTICWCETCYLVVARRAGCHLAGTGSQVIINQELCATHQGRCQAQKLGQDKGKQRRCTSWSSDQQLKMLRSGVELLQGIKQVIMQGRERQIYRLLGQ